ncbi:cation transporter [Demequina lutea]|uniref:Co/Zn/Cd efflux system component n=1 Tax=Demequina lutea TaxID=431489 RepID=A0A7Z0CKP1_9MICO|nr:cation transporter [Demequina lutea]NYI41925.1 Co/Zn/Cd efflux system component [Demequina lutea]
MTDEFMPGKPAGVAGLSASERALRKAVMWVAILNLAYGVVEFTMSRLIGSVSLVADSIDFVEDGLLNILIFFAVAWTLHRRARIGHALALIILVPAAATLVTAVLKVLDPSRPAVIPLTLTATGALLVNLACAAILVSHRKRGGSLASAAWLSARNDAFANLAILAAAAVAMGWDSGWPDIIVGVAIAYLNADAGLKVWRAASRERLESKAAQA